jgi:hypothetical protein
LGLPRGCFGPGEVSIRPNGEIQRRSDVGVAGVAAETVYVAADDGFGAGRAPSRASAVFFYAAAAPIPDRRRGISGTPSGTSIR